MIAKITETNDQEFYAPRFAYITQKLAEAGSEIVIDSLEAYYANIEEIAKLSTKEDESNAGYLLLVAPADESYFEIDANARTIAVPASFKKNGVGVWNDHQAEMLVFKIDRYFDQQDLYQTNIAINWNFIPAGKREATYSETQEEAGLFANVELEPGYITFGFLINKNMTPSKGTLNFSVTFYQESAGEISYALNTQTVSVAINDGLSLENPSEVKNNGNSLLERLKNSTYTDESLEPIVTPVWRTGDEEDGIKLGLKKVENFTMGENGEEPEYISLIAQAYSAGHTGAMLYTWSANPGDISPALPEGEVTSPEDYFLVGVVAEENDDHFVENHIYYVKDQLGRLDTTNPLDSQAKLDEHPGEEIYELGSVYKAYGAGSYQVKARGRKVVGSAVANSDEAASVVCEIPAAAMPTVTLQVNSTIGEVEGLTFEDENSPYTYIDSQSAPSITATIVSTDENNNLGAIALELLSEDDIPELTTEQIAEKRELGDYVFETVNNASKIIEMNENGVVEEGRYKVRAINYKNHTYNVSEPSETIETAFIAPAITDIDVVARVTYANGTASDITVIDNGSAVSSGDSDYTSISFGSAEAIPFTITNNQENINENAWISYTVQEGLIVDGAFVPMEESENDPAFEVLTLEQNVNTFSISNTEDRSFFRIKIDNHYKDTIRTTYSGYFYVS